jgi:intracellular septation protein
MKLLASFLPIILFFAAYKLFDIYVATGVAMATALIQTLWHWFVYKELEKMHLVTLALLMVFGGMTLIFHDPTFIKWKPSVINWLFGLAFMLSPLFGGKTLTERMMSQAVQLPEMVWRRLNTAWWIFFISVGFLNIYVAYHFDEETWVNFKLFGLLGLTFAFIIGQSFYLARHIQDEAKEES